MDRSEGAAMAGSVRVYILGDKEKMLGGCTAFWALPSDLLDFWARAACETGDHCYNAT